METNRIPSSLKFLISSWIILQLLGNTSTKKCDRRSKKLEFVTVHIDGRAENGQQIESTHIRGVPMEFQLGIGMVFVGLDEGLHGMCVGEKKKLTIPSDKAYKKRGKQKPQLPKNTTLIYDVELLHISNYATMSAFRWLDFNDDKRISKSEALELIEMTFEASPQFPSIDANHMLDMYMNMHDANSDGFINEDEYKESSSKAQKMQMELANHGTWKATKRSKSNSASSNGIKEEL